MFAIGDKVMFIVDVKAGGPIKMIDMVDGVEGVPYYAPFPVLGQGTVVDIDEDGDIYTVDFDVALLECKPEWLAKTS